ncbi:MAG: RdgB/HAM1 family non-canonical purine NTP pyrophosphatase [Bryobacteraceae bacterium]
MIELYCATSNPGKLAEFRLAAEAVPDAPPVAIDLLPGFAAIPPCCEDGATFEENALIKARHYGSHTEGLLFADDSGLVVDALDGAPGVHSARFSGPGATNQSNNRLLLEKLRGVKDRKAAFVCAIALVKAGEPVCVSTGRVEGVILEEPRGANGFGYDPLFFYPPFGCTFGEAGEAAKFKVSHRGQALRQMLRRLA